MKNTTCLLKAGFVSAVLTAGALVAPAAYADGPQVGVNIEVPMPTVTVAPDDYVYYPAYGAYYSPRRHLFAFVHDGSWQWRAAPPGVTADVVLASPPVKMGWHDAPWLHHKDVLKAYPRNWRADHMDHRDRDKDRDRDRDKDKR
jgi:hypothetical protein